VVLRISQVLGKTWQRALPSCGNRSSANVLAISGEMMATYRIVHFVPEPINGGRFPVGAMVTTGAITDWLQAQRLPDVGCLGGMGAKQLLDWLLGELTNPGQWDKLHGGALGPHLWIADQREIPGPELRAKAWVAEFVLPRAPAAIKRQTAAVLHARRATLGFQFLRDHQLAGHIKPTFEPKKDGAELLGPYASLLQPISQWGERSNGLVMLEPIAPAKRRVDADLEQVLQRFLAYRGVRRELDIAPQAMKLTSYLLPGGDAKWRREVMGELRMASDQVVDTHDSAQLVEWGAELREAVQ
jgi:hypothetical protein